jgi:hypothetical protein
VKKSVNGIGFALSASDLLEVLERFYPSAEPAAEKLPAPAAIAGRTPVSPESSRTNNSGTVVLSEPKGAEIWVDYAFVGTIPATLTLAVGRHFMVIRSRGHADRMHYLNVLKDSHVSLDPEKE